MLTSRKLKGAACAAVVAATAFIVSPPADAAVPVPPVTDNVFILPGASPDAWAPRILGRIDPWATDNPRVRKIDADYYSCSSPCNLSVIRYPRTAGPLFGPNAPYADESIATGVDLTKTAINADGQMVVAGLSLGSITADAVQRSLDADPNRPPSDRVTFIVSGDPSRVTPLSTGIGSFLPEGFRIPVLGWTVTRPEANSNYDTVVVVGEYDLTADFPDRPWNILALINSLFGFQSSHGPSALSSPTEVPQENIRETENDKGATTTTYLVPRPVLPMLEPLDGVLPPSSARRTTCSSRSWTAAIRATTPPTATSHPICYPPTDCRGWPCRPGSQTLSRRRPMCQRCPASTSDSVRWTAALLPKAHFRRMFGNDPRTACSGSTT